LQKQFFIDVKGGLGYNISLCRVLTEIKSESYKFYVRSPYWDVFEACGAVDGVYKPEEIRDFIFDAKAKDAEIIEHRLYDMSDFIYKKLNYREAWYKLLGIEPSEHVNFTTDFLDKTLEVWPNLNANLNQMKEAIGGKDFIIVQFCGGQSPLDVPQDGDWNKKVYDYQHEPLKRHYPTDKAQKFIDLYKEAHPDTVIIQYALPNEPQLEGCEHFVVPYLVYYELAKDEHCKGFIAIDSSLQHLITGITPGTVIWGHSMPENFGYECNKNIIQDCRRDDILYFTELGASGAKIDYIEPDKLMEYIK
jgi:hypothetical protein